MTPVLDTHVLLWMVLEPKRLSSKAKRLIDRSLHGGGLAISSISLWEIAMLISRGRLSVQGTASGWITELLSRTGVGVADLSPAIAELSTSFGPDFPRDPADRIIAATARAEATTLITADERIQASPLLKCVW